MSTTKTAKNAKEYPPRLELRPAILSKAQRDAYLKKGDLLPAWELVITHRFAEVGSFMLFESVSTLILPDGQEQQLVGYHAAAPLDKLKAIVSQVSKRVK